LFFFFQAEDGIRDKLVTGVQTCALPIWPAPWQWGQVWAMLKMPRDVSTCPRPPQVAQVLTREPGSAPAPPQTSQPSGLVTLISRSEERRVGKECRARWSPYR